MLADAISAETFKLSRNRLTAFFAFLFLPCAALVVGLIGELFLRSAMQPRSGLPLPEFPFDVGQALITSVQQASNPLAILFCLIGAATLFAGEYRWETWRLILPRATRMNQLGAKILVFAVACALSLLLTTVAIFVAGLIGALANGQTIVADLDGRTATTVSGMFAVGWVNLLQAGAIAALIGVLSRSIMAAMLAPLGIGIAQGILQAVTSLGVQPADLEWWQPLAIPAMAAELLRGSLQQIGLPGMDIPGPILWASIASFAVWIILGFGGALLLFGRQDLSKE